jgi:hypothetical protein
MGRPESVTSPETLTVRSVEDYLREIREKSKHGSKKLRLDWHNLRHVEAPAASILSQALLEALFRSGLLFALANREGDTAVFGMGVSYPRWKHSWLPGDLSSIRALFDPGAHESKQERLFEPSGEEIPDIFGRYHAAFINPHRLPPSGSHEEIGNVMRPWLSEVLPNVWGVAHRPVRERFLSDVNAVIEELLQNVREHASRRPDGQPSQSLVQLSVTLGGGSESFNRIYISVQDSGPGIVATARPKLRFSAASEVADEKFLTLLFAGELDSWNRGRGMGLPRVWRICQERGDSTLWVASRELRVLGKNQVLRERTEGFDIGGTVLVIMIPEPKGDDQHDR